jgi:hypothetical protein
LGGGLAQQSRVSLEESTMHVIALFPDWVGSNQIAFGKAARKRFDGLFAYGLSGSITGPMGNILMVAMPDILVLSVASYAAVASERGTLFL